MIYVNQSDPIKNYGKVPGATRIVWWNANGSVARQLEQRETVYVTHGSVRLGPHGELWVGLFLRDNRVRALTAPRMSA